MERSGTIYRPRDGARRSKTRQGIQGPAGSLLRKIKKLRYSWIIKQGKAEAFPCFLFPRLPKRSRQTLRASSETEPVFPARNISLGARADRRRCTAADDRKKMLSARRGVDRKAGRFFSPRLRVLSLELSLHKQRKRGLIRCLRATPSPCAEKARYAQSRRFAGDGNAGERGLPRVFHTLGVTDTGNANLREMGPPINDRRYDIKITESGSVGRMRTCPAFPIGEGVRDSFFFKILSKFVCKSTPDIVQ